MTTKATTQPKYLRAGTQTGSLINHVLSGSADKTPEPGDGATILWWTDRNAATIVEVSTNGKTVKIQQDIATRTDKNGMSESQEYEYTRNPEAMIQTFTLRRNGAWVRQGESMRGGQRLSIGQRREYHDYGF